MWNSILLSDLHCHLSLFTNYQLLLEFIDSDLSQYMNWIMKTGSHTTGFSAKQLQKHEPTCYTTAHSNALWKQQTA